MHGRLMRPAGALALAAVALSGCWYQGGATGAQRWEAPARYSGVLPGMLTGVAISGDTLYVAGAQRDADTGADTAVLDAYPLGGCAQAACPPAWSVDLGPTTPSAEPTVAGGVVYVPLRASNESAPAVAALDAAGCGAPSCDEMSRVDLVDGRVGLYGPKASSTAVGSGRLLAVFLPGLYGTTTSEVVSFGPAG